MTIKAVFTGTILSVLLAFLAVLQQALGVGGGEEIGFADGFGTGALFFLFALICLNTWMRRLGIIKSGLSPQELLVVFSMLLMVTAVATGGLVIYLLPHISGFSHFASPENKWQEIVLPHLPDGLTIEGGGATKGFFEGLGPGISMPFQAWLGPLCAWGVLLGAFYFSMISILVILRKRWFEQERLPFPVAQVPLALVHDEAGRPLNNGLFWMGFAFPGLTELTVILHRLFPVLSPIHLYYYTRIYRNSIGFFIRAHYSLIGVGYLVSLEVLSSILLFTFLAHFQIFLIVFSGSTIPYSAPYRPYVSYTQLHQEGLGALLILVLFGIYEARGHLRDVLGKALGWSPEVDDDDEQVSYRTAVIGLTAGVVLICFWLRMTGISWWVVPIFVALMLTTFLGVTRILAETGFMTQAPLSPMQVFIH